MLTYNFTAHAPLSQFIYFFQSIQSQLQLPIGNSRSNFFTQLPSPRLLCDLSILDRSTHHTLPIMYLFILYTYLFVFVLQIHHKIFLNFLVPPHGYELNNLNNEALDAPNLYQEEVLQPRFPEPVFHVDSNEPVSMPVDLVGEEPRFKHASPVYQSAVLHPTVASESGGYCEQKEKKNESEHSKSLKDRYYFML